ncbi:MAG: hypothetical protein DRP71_05385 [Verrucomicrobia bacterium]|nr:MAG: hypothetical protein DRP71_05385 [Verrucomicrobiota bacterium]
MTAILDPVPGVRAIEEFQQACLKRIVARPGDREAHDIVLDLYLETVRRLEKGWMLNSVLTNALIRLSHL